jgi:hypothetical protein
MPYLLPLAPTARGSGAMCAQTGEIQVTIIAMIEVLAYCLKSSAANQLSAKYLSV